MNEGMKDFPKPSITADVILFDRVTQQVCLIQRKHAPFQNHWAIIGGFFNSSEHQGVAADASIEDAAWRELGEEASVDAFGPQVIGRGFSHFVDTIGRDPRGRVVTFVYFLILDGKVPVKAQDDAKDFAWFPVTAILNNLVPLAFDHKQILTKFLTKPCSSWQV